MNNDGKEVGIMEIPETPDSSSLLVPTFAISPREAHERLVALQRFVAGEMQVGVDFGKIPGAKKPSLWQPGAQKLCNIFGFVPTFTLVKEVEDYDRPLFVYRYRCDIISKRDDSVQGQCEATCSTMESKYQYRWRDATEEEKEDFEKGPAEDFADFKMRDIWRKGAKRGILQKRIPNPDVFDLQNTVCRMAQKRALVGATIHATRAADIFSLSLDEEEEVKGRGAEPKPKPTKKEVEKEAEEGYGPSQNPAEGKPSAEPDEQREGFLQQMALVLTKLGERRFKEAFAAMGYDDPIKVPESERNKVLMDLWGIVKKEAAER